MIVSKARIEGGNIRDWESFHDEFARVFGFPNFYGRNLDAWIDCLTCLDRPEDEMTALHVAPGGVLTLEIVGADYLKREHSQQYEALVECSAFVNWRRLEAGDPPVLALAFQVDTPPPGGSVGIAECVEDLCIVFCAHVRKTAPRDAVLVEYLAIIGTMAAWRDADGLDAWEAHVQKHAPDLELRERVGDRLAALAEEIFELGCLNLYGAIDPAGTKAEFERVRRRLVESGVSDVPGATHYDFGVW